MSIEWFVVGLSAEHRAIHSKTSLVTVGDKVTTTLTR
jgi:uncharacterized protein (UPF0218 family)